MGWLESKGRAVGLRVATLLAVLTIAFTGFTVSPAMALAAEGEPNSTPPLPLLEPITDPGGYIKDPRRIESHLTLLELSLEINAAVVIAESFGMTANDWLSAVVEGNEERGIEYDLIFAVDASTGEAISYRMAEYSDAVRSGVAAAAGLLEAGDIEEGVSAYFSAFYKQTQDGGAEPAEKEGQYVGGSEFTLFSDVSAWLSKWSQPLIVVGVLIAFIAFIASQVKTHNRRQEREISGGIPGVSGRSVGMYRGMTPEQTLRDLNERSGVSTNALDAGTHFSKRERKALGMEMERTYLN